MHVVDRFNDVLEAEGEDELAAAFTKAGGFLGLFFG
jgi:hypothetical protein